MIAAQHIAITAHHHTTRSSQDRHIGIELQHRHTTYTARLPHNTSPQDHIIGITSPHDTIATRSPHRYRIATSPHDTIARRHGRHITSPHHNIGITSPHDTIAIHDTITPSDSVSHRHDCQAT
jgi:hypothetical protein